MGDEPLPISEAEAGRFTKVAHPPGAISSFQVVGFNDAWDRGSGVVAADSAEQNTSPLLSGNENSEPKPARPLLFLSCNSASMDALAIAAMNYHDKEPMDYRERLQACQPAPKPLLLWFIYGFYMLPICFLNASSI